MEAECQDGEEVSDGGGGVWAHVDAVRVAVRPSPVGDGGHLWLRVSVRVQMLLHIRRLADRQPRGLAAVGLEAEGKGCILDNVALTLSSVQGRAKKRFPGCESLAGKLW